MIAYAFASDELLVASPKSGSEVRILNAKTWEIKLKYASKTAQRVSAAISSDGRHVAFALANCCLELWDVTELKE